ncbi:MAG TPA: hypothetical protein VGY98_00595 [Verrucomicrobiae bacterium]|nr:hypothetical protein [Verrucomicrobiae bacterium]
MNTITNDVPLKISEALVSTWDQDENHAVEDNSISPRRQLAGKWSSRGANFGWNDTWILQGIPELDSPMAG